MTLAFSNDDSSCLGYIPKALDNAEHIPTQNGCTSHNCADIWTLCIVRVRKRSLQSANVGLDDDPGNRSWFMGKTEIQRQDNQ